MQKSSHSGEARTREQRELAWRQEIQRRVNELDSGRVRLIPWSEVRSRLLAAQKNAR